VASSERSRSAGTITRAAPEHNAINSSETAASKPTDANCNTREVGSTWKWAICATAKFTAPACGTATPFGTPVDPDV
jgi:hypothetical protein